MKKLSLITSIIVLSFALSLEAAQDTATINVSMTKVNYLYFTGTASGSTKYYTVDDIQLAGGTSQGVKLNLGTLGVESNFSGACDIAISALNNFRLRHTVSNERLANFRIFWKNNVMSGNPKRTNQFTLPTCNSAATDMLFQTVAFANPIAQNGIYQDVITVTVTSQ